MARLSTLKGHLSISQFCQFLQIFHLQLLKNCHLPYPVNSKIGPLELVPRLQIGLPKVEEGIYPGTSIDILESRLLYCHNLAKWLSYFLFFFLFCFLLFSQIITKVECGKVSHDNHRVTECSGHRSQHVIGQSHDRSNIRTMGGQSIATKVKYISSVKNLTGALLRFPYQLG